MRPPLPDAGAACAAARVASPTAASAAVAFAKNARRMDVPWVRAVARRMPTAAPNVADAAGPRSGNGGFVGPLVAAVIDPGHGHFLALGAALELEVQERVLGHGRAEVGPEYFLALVLRRHGLDMPGRNDLAGRILALAGFHVVLHQDLHVDHAAVLGGAYAHRVCHAVLLWRVGKSGGG